MSVYFISGAGTEIGKTYVTALLIRQLKAAGRDVVALKPVISGAPPIDHPAFAASDTAQLIMAQGLELTPATVEACSPWRFEQPLSPDMAAAAEGRTVTLRAVADWCGDRIIQAGDHTVVLIEGVGGLMSPMTSDALNLDLIKALGCTVLLVTGSYLGALTHALTALESLKAHGVRVAATVLNESANSGVDFDATVESLERFSGGTSMVSVRLGGSMVDIELT